MSRLSYAMTKWYSVIVNTSQRAVSSKPRVGSVSSVWLPSFSKPDLPHLCSGDSESFKRFHAMIDEDRVCGIPLHSTWHVVSIQFSSVQSLSRVRLFATP